eukprot:TRINITY_DN7645_c0_g2_i2.p1 TRINITY_DN7645_c0_g2~~TRINITY_DN7645_c0_g2_i2.p1  ORF type:complete len:224 (-),score=-5.36 TRINITY_DN7645_c0_g2_i2:252-923(-)
MGTGGWRGAFLFFFFFFFLNHNLITRFWGVPLYFFFFFFFFFFQRTTSKIQIKYNRILLSKLSTINIYIHRYIRQKLTTIELRKKSLTQSTQPSACVHYDSNNLLTIQTKHTYKTFKYYERQVNFFLLETKLLLILIYLNINKLNQIKNRTQKSTTCTYCRNDEKYNCTVAFIQIIRKSTVFQQAFNFIQVIVQQIMEISPRKNLAHIYVSRSNPLNLQHSNI